MSDEGASWAAVVGRLPAKILVLMAAIACLAFAALIGATLDSVYRTRQPFKIAGYVFGYGSEDPSGIETLKMAVDKQVASVRSDLNEQLAKINNGVVPDDSAVLVNSSSKNGDGYAANQQGRCPAGEVIIGIQPRASAEGSSLRYQCGRFQQLKVP